MWYIKEIKYRDRAARDRTPVEITSLSYDRASGVYTTVWLTLCDSETGAIKVVSSLDFDNLPALIGSKRPYGWIDIYSRTTDFMFIVVDEYSWKFLDYVDSVREVEHCPVGNLLFSLGQFLDDVNSLIAVKTLVGYGFPLFQIICGLPAGWYGEHYYICSWWRFFEITFNDYVRARILVSKALVSGYNPFRDFLESSSFL